MSLDQKLAALNGLARNRPRLAPVAKPQPPAAIPGPVAADTQTADRVRELERRDAARSRQIEELTKSVGGALSLTTKNIGKVREDLRHLATHGELSGESNDDPGQHGGGGAAGI